MNKDDRQLIVLVISESYGWVDVAKTFIPRENPCRDTRTEMGPRTWVHLGIQSVQLATSRIYTLG